MNRQQLLTEQFYQWEIRGRGWLVAPHPIEPEPPFHPFFSHRLIEGHTDDTKRETVLSSIANLFKKQSPPTSTERSTPPYDLYPAESEQPLCMYSVAIPKGTVIKAERMEQLLFMLGEARLPVSFEIIGTSERTMLQFVVREQDSLHLYSQLTAYLPECQIWENDDHLLLYKNALCVVDIGLQEEFVRSIGTGFSADQDPYIGFMGVLEHLRDDEQVVLQILFSATQNQWPESIMRAVTIDGKESFFVNAPDMPSLAEKKVSTPLYGVHVRLLCQATDFERADIILHNATTSLCSATRSLHNTLMQLPPAYPAQDHVDDVLDRVSRRFGMLLNLRELATLVHIPSPAVRSSKLFAKRQAKRVQPAYTTGDYLLGINDSFGAEIPVFLTNEQRLSHIHIIGATGTGKSTLLSSLMLQDIHNGEGFAVLDPHGDLIEHVLSYIPEHRIPDVLLIDPTDSDYPIGFNLLHAHTDIEKEVLASDLVALFRRFSSSWGDQMNSVFANAILAILESSKGGTLIDLRRFLIEKPFRDEYLLSVKDDAIRYYWQKEYPLLKSTSVASILTRLDTFLRPKPIRNMVSQKKSIDFEEAMDSKKIVLVKLSQGLIGEENSYLLGACIVAKLQQSAMARQAKAKELRTNFFLYIDEFHHFVTPSLSHILSGTRKYGLGLVVVHQDMTQISKHDAEVASADIANAGTRIVFRLGDTDAKKFAEGFETFTAEDIRNLDRGEAIIRIGKAEHDCNIFILPVPDSAVLHLQEDVITASRSTYATPLTDLRPISMPEPVQVPKDIAPPTHEPVTVVVPKEAPVETLHTVEPIPPASSVETSDTIVVLEKQREERQHRTLQHMVKKLAEERGYRATIEHLLPDGKQVDVSLERSGVRIAVEISISTSPQWELHNIQKCLGAGYTTVIACSPHTHTLEKLSALVTAHCTPEEARIVLYTHPDDIGLHIPFSTPPKEAQSEQRMKGYRVTVSYGSIDPKEQGQQNKNIARIVQESVSKKERQ